MDGAQQRTEIIQTLVADAETAGRTIGAGIITGIGAARIVEAPNVRITPIPAPQIVRPFVHFIQRLPRGRAFVPFITALGNVLGFVSAPGRASVPERRPIVSDIQSETRRPEFTERARVDRAMSLQNAARGTLFGIAVTLLGGAVRIAGQFLHGQERRVQGLGPGVERARPPRAAQPAPAQPTGEQGEGQAQRRTRTRRLMTVTTVGVGFLYFLTLFDNPGAPIEAGTFFAGRSPQSSGQGGNPSTSDGSNFSSDSSSSLFASKNIGENNLWGSWVEDILQKLGLEECCPDLFIDMWQKLGLQDWFAGYWIGSIFCILFCKRSLLSLAFQTYIVSKNPLFFPLSLGSNNSTPQDIANIAAAIYSLSLTTFVIFFFLSIVLVSIWRNLLPEAKTQVKNSPYFVLLFTGLGFLFLVSCFLYSMSARLL